MVNVILEMNDASKGLSRFLKTVSDCLFLLDIVIYNVRECFIIFLYEATPPPDREHTLLAAKYRYADIYLWLWM